MLSEGTRKRISRIRRRATPEVREAYEQGLISARRADTLLYLELEEQRTAIAGILSEREATVRRSKIAAEVIRSYVIAGRRDLAELQNDLKQALAAVA